MHIPFIAHTHARQMYVTITYTRLKRVFHFISCRIVLISVQDGGDGCESTLKDEIPQPGGSLYTFSCYIEQANQEFRHIYGFNKMIAIHNTCETHSNFRIFKFCMLFNFVY